MVKVTKLNINHVAKNSAFLLNPFVTGHLNKCCLDFQLLKITFELPVSIIQLVAGGLTDNGGCVTYIVLFTVWQVIYSNFSHSALFHLQQSNFVLSMVIYW